LKRYYTPAIVSHPSLGSCSFMRPNNRIIYAWMRTTTIALLCTP
jgi:hypothetical protein